ncbi:MAG: hypothetical protein RR228_03460 [Bacilli bacterium]
MKDKLIKLIDLKSILSLIFTITTCILAFKRIIHSETFIALTSSIITYYFARNINNEIK